MHNLSREVQLVAIELAALEELIQKRSLIALTVSESRNEAGDASVIFHGHLYKFAFLQERVHPGISLFGVRLGCRLLRGLLRRSGLLRDGCRGKSGCANRDYEDQTESSHEAHLPCSNRTMRGDRLDFYRR